MAGEIYAYKEFICLQKPPEHFQLSEASSPSHLQMGITKHLDFSVFSIMFSERRFSGNSSLLQKCHRTSKVKCVNKIQELCSNSL